MQHRMWVLLGLLCAALVAADAAAASLLWRADKADRTLYLFGSIHVGEASMYPLAPAVQQAFEKADVLAVEINPYAVEAGEMIRLTLQEGVISDPQQGLRQRLDADSWRLLEHHAAELGVPVELFQQQRPWLAAMTLTMLAAQRAGYSEEYGVDRHFIERADGAKPIVELETVQSQVGVFTRLSEDEQQAMLQQTLTDLGDAAGYFRQMFAAWREGDAQALDALMNQMTAAGAAGERLHHLLLTERNQAMAENIEALIEQGRTPFVVVGAGHLVGADGLVALFRERGYRLTQL